MILVYSILTFSWAFFVSLFAIPSIIQVAHKKQLLDIPNNRRLHLLNTPRLGGLAIFAGFISSLMLFGEINNSIQKLIAATIIIFFIGLKDDMVSVSAFKKFFVQILGAGIVVFLGDVRITGFHGVLNMYALPEGASYLFTLIVILGITNAFNLIDGLDGLAGTIAFLTSIFYAIIFFYFDAHVNYPYILACLCLSGAVVGFLKYNIHRAQIFMGDTGSLICGFIIAFLAVKLIALQDMRINNNISMPAIAIAPIMLPVADTLRVFIIRLLSGISPFSPDNNHLHHRLTDLGISQMAIVCIVCAYTLTMMAASIWLRDLDSTVLILSMFTFTAAVMVIVELIFKKHRKSCIGNI